MKKIGILGTGNIGTDLLIKLNKLGYENIAFVGRRETSDGIKLASSLGFKTSIEGIDYFKKNSDFDVVLDCTNAFDAVEHYNVLRNLGIKVIDLTPAKIGQICVPTINGSDINKYDNINMITCGGQASLPMIHAICESVKDVEYIEVVSQIASKSAGMSTRINIDNYIETTKYAIKQFSTTKNCKVILNINPAEPCVDMQTTIFMKINNLETINFENIVENVYSRLKEIKRYVPNYELVMPPMVNENNILMLSVKVRGLGDYLPEYAGNLDIINCAAIKILEFL
jgi:acetaldehyde dehydrogenase (acetylating)